MTVTLKMESSEPSRWCFPIPNSFTCTEKLPAGTKPGQTYRISETRSWLSRLSFFLWSAPPDSELINLATQNEKAPH